MLFEMCSCGVRLKLLFSFVSIVLGLLKFDCFCFFDECRELRMLLCLFSFIVWLLLVKGMFWWI